MLRQLPDLRLEQVAQRIDRRRVVGVPGEVAEQPLGFVAGADRQGVQLLRVVEQDDHAHARHHIALAAPVHLRVEPCVAVDRVADVHRGAAQPKLVDHQLGVFQAFFARGPIGHADGENMLRPERLGA